jgi:CDP-diacylglycerol--serine O-phosphatidyltransferase
MLAPGRSSASQHALAGVLTGCNLAAGIAATLLSGEGRPVRRSTLMLVAAVCDALDGPLARRSGRPTELGAAVDGVADLISFGVAPAALLASREPTGRIPLSRIAPGFYMGTAAWRLARYGFAPRTSHVFRGLPLTGAGVILAIGCHARLPPRALTCLSVALGVAMVSPVRVLSGEALAREAYTRHMRMRRTDCGAGAEPSSIGATASAIPAVI